MPYWKKGEKTTTYQIHHLAVALSTHVKVSRVILEHYMVAMTTFPFPALG